MWNDLPLFTYLRCKWKWLVLQGVFLLLFAAVFFLYDLSAEAFFYALALCLAVSLVVLAADYALYRRKHRMLEQLLLCIENTAFALPAPQNALEADYQALLSAVCDSRTAIIAQNENR